ANGTTLWEGVRYGQGGIRCHSIRLGASRSVPRPERGRHPGNHRRGVRRIVDVWTDAVVMRGSVELDCVCLRERCGSYSPKAGKAPICWRMLRISPTPRCSTILPSAMRNRDMPTTLHALPVGDMPRISRVCVPVIVMRAA